MAKDKQADPAVSPAELNTCPQATNYRATLAERFNTRFGGGEESLSPDLTAGFNPAISPTDRGPTNFMVTNGDE